MKKCVLFLFSFALFTVANSLLAQGTAFTYQGQLSASGSPANGNYDFTFALFNNSSTNPPQLGATLTDTNVGVTNGLFTVTLDFGSVFTGNATWLAISVRSNNVGNYTALTPLQELTPTPYALYASNANTVVGSVSASQLIGAIAASNIANGTITSNLLASGSVGSSQLATNIGLWTQVGSNVVYTGGNVGIGTTTPNAPLQVAGPIIGGGSANTIAAGLAASTIAGGGVGGYPNSVAGESSFIGAGNANTIGSNLNNSFIGTGYENLIDGTSSFIGSGNYNTIESNANFSALGSGVANSIQTNSSESVIGGGSYNSILANSGNSVIAGGTANIIQTNSGGSVIGGGSYNSIQDNSGDSVVAGGTANTVGSNSVESFIGSGYGNVIQTNSSDSAIGSGSFNSIQDNSDDSTVAGGYANTIGSNSVESFIGSGYGNIIQTNSGNSVIGGGSFNSILANSTQSAIAVGYADTIQTNSGACFIGSGQFNVIQPNCTSAAIVAGYGNVIQSNTTGSFIGGGIGNTAGYCAAVPGGDDNQALGSFSFASGYGAQALYQGDFVWADSQGTAFPATGNDQFNVRAQGGVNFVTGGAGMTLDGQNILANTSSGVSLSGNFSGNGSGLNNLNASQLSSGTIPLAQLPAAVVTNNEPNVVLVNLTLSSNLNLSSPAAIYAGGSSLLYFDSLNNFYAGPGAGPLTNAGGANTGIGYQTLGNNTNGTNNTAMGYQALANNTNGSYNVAYGERALFNNTSGNDNTANGRHALEFNIGGNNNIALGYQAGENFMGNESGNIDIGNPGVLGENNIIRIGSGQTSTFIAGVLNGNGSGLNNLNASQLSSGTIPLAQLPPMIAFLNSNQTFTGQNTFSTNVGIGTTAPEENLSIAAPSLATGSNASARLSLASFGGNRWIMDSISGYDTGSGTPGGSLQFIDADHTVTNLTLNSSGYVGIDVNNPTQPLQMAGGAYCTGTQWQNASDRNIKENFTAISPRDVLAKVVAMPITQWKYKVEPNGIKHLGPVAQDFHAAFGLGNSDKAIGTVDESGVALAAIQGVNEKLETELKGKDAEIQDMKARLDKLEAVVKSITAGQ